MKPISSTSKLHRHQNVVSVTAVMLRRMFFNAVGHISQALIEPPRRIIIGDFDVLIVYCRAKWSC
jgi:hypothetical protein